MHKIHQIGKLRSFSDEELPRLQALLDQMLNGINENPFHRYEDVTVTTPATANTTFAVTLGELGKVPTGYVVLGVSYTPVALRDNDGNKLRDAAGNPVDAFAAAVVYTAPKAADTLWTRNKLFLRCTVASATLTLRVT